MSTPTRKIVEPSYSHSKTGFFSEAIDSLHSFLKLRFSKIYLNKIDNYDFLKLVKKLKMELIFFTII